MLYSPSHTPEFSAVENVFADMKRRLGTFQFVNAKKTAESMSKILFQYKSRDMKVFFRKTLGNILDFWKKFHKKKVMREVDV